MDQDSIRNVSDVHTVRRQDRPQTPPLLSEVVSDVRHFANDALALLRWSLGFQRAISYRIP